MKGVLILLSAFIIGLSFASASVSLDYNMTLYDRDTNTNGQVSKLQEFLKSTICPDIFVSGFFGSKTLSCVKEYQSQKSLPSTGYVGQMTKAALSNDTGEGLKAAVVDGTVTSNFCGSSALPIRTVAGQDTSSTITWNSTTVVMGPNVVLPLRVYLNQPFTVNTNYQNSDVTIETNPLSSDPSNGITIKRLSSTSFEVTITDGKFITKGKPEAKLYVRASSSYSPKKGEVYKDGCSFTTVSPDSSSNNSNTTRTPILSLAGLTLPINGAVTLSVANLMPGASVPRLCVMGTNTAAYNDTCSKTKPSGVLFEVTPNNLNESVPYCQPQSSKVDGFGLATYHCTASTPGNIKVNAASTYRNPYNIWVYDQDVDVSPYDNSKTHYNKSNIVQLSIADSGNSSISDTCPAGQAMYVAYSSGSGPACTSCEFIPEATRSGIAKCSNVTDAPATWQTSTVSGSVDKGVLVSGFERYSQCPNGAPGSVGQTCSNKGYSCYMPSNSSSFTVYKCPGYTGATATLKGKAYSEDNTGKLTPVPAGYQIAAGLLIPGWSCSKVVTTASDGSYDFNGNAGCIIGLPNIALYAPSEILNGTGPGQTVFSNANSLASVRPTSYGNVPDLIYYKGTGSYTFANNPVIGNPDTSTCAYDSNQQDNMRLEKIFTQTPSKAAMGTPGTYNNKTYWYAGEPNGGFWQRSIGKCSDPVTTNPPSGPAARSLVAYVHKLSCSDMPSTNMSIFKQGLSAALQPEFYVGLGASQSVGNLVSKRVLAYYSSSPTWEIMPGFGIIISPSEYAQLIDSLPTVSRSDALKKCGM